jgi:hypothetical protein
MARKRRLFGPLFYSTAVVAIVAVLFVCWLKISERFSQATVISATVNIDSELASALSLLSRQASNERLAGAASLSNLLAKMGPGDFTAGQHARVAAALEGALKDPDSVVRAQAASGLAPFVGSTRQARAALSAALDDEDAEVRFNAAVALMRVGGELTASGLATLSALVAGEEQPAQADRARILNAMASAGPAGVDAALAALKKLLASVDPGIRRRGVMCAAELDPLVAERARSELEACFQDKDVEVGCAAAVAILHLPDPSAGGPTGPAPGGGAGMIAAIPGAPGGMAMMSGFVPSPSASLAAKRYPLALRALERAVTDPSISFALRSSALNALGETSARSLRKCGLELARQLSHQDRQARLDAARLLHGIEDQALAGPIDDEALDDEP